MMKHLKYAGVFLLAMALCFGALGCKRKQAAVRVEGTLEEIMAEIYDGTGIDEADWPARGTIAIDETNASYYLGTDAVTFSEGLASEALINAIPHSVCLIRLPDGADAEAAKALIRENANPNKWICVGVSDSDVVVDNIGNLVILIMADESEALHESFLSLSKQA